MLHILKSNAPHGAPYDLRIMNVEISNEVYIHKPSPWGYLQFTNSCMELDSILA
jgi:hypothetical protein